MKSVIENKTIVIGVSGGIAAYKAAELVRLIKKSGAGTRVIMTRNSRNFVGKATFRALSEEPVYDDVFDDDSKNYIRHVEWAREADAVVLAPATANIIGKFANGIADDALSTFLLAVTAPVLICPAMNTNMLENKVVQRNIHKLREYGYHVLDPDSGELACGDVGPGRLPDPPVIFDRLIAMLAPKDFQGKKVVVTAGPTREAIDPVRFISNPSSGKMGYAIARAAEYRGANVTLITGPTHLHPPANVRVIQVISAEEMAQAVWTEAGSTDIIIKSAAVGDYRVKNVEVHKIKKNNDEINLELVKNPDILQKLGDMKSHQLLVGFAAETQNLHQNACEKLKAKNLDLIVGNIIGPINSGFESDTNQVTLFYKDGRSEVLPVMPKISVAHFLLDRIREMLPA